MSDREKTFSKLSLKKINNEVVLSVSGEIEESGEKIDLQFIFEPYEAFAVGNALVCQSFEILKPKE